MLFWGSGKRNNIDDLQPVTYSMLSKEGERENNEDNIGMYERDGEFCFVLCDGLGGHGKGELASLLAVEACMGLFAEKGYGEEVLRESFVTAQQSILKTQKMDPEAMDMKTTMVLLHIGKDSIQWGHVGDSRLYYFVNDKIVGRTIDHSVPQMLVASGEIKESEIRHHPDRNRLLRVMGLDEDEPRYTLEDVMERKGFQQFLLCSDGFWELIDEKKMQQTLKKAKNPGEWIQLMEEIVLQNGRGTNMDNYSAVAVWLKGDK